MAAKKSAKKAKKSAAKKSAAKTPKAGKKSAKKGKKSAKTAAVVHWEIQAKNPGKLRKFYGDLFAWKMQTMPQMDYSMVSSRSKDDGIDGGIGAAMGGPSGPTGVTFYVQVDDIRSTLAAAEKLGATTLMPRTEHEMVTMAMFRDPEGHRIGLVEA